MDGCCYLSWQRGGKGEIGAERYEKNSVTGQWAVLWEGGRGRPPCSGSSSLASPALFLLTLHLPLTALWSPLLSPVTPIPLQLTPKYHKFPKSPPEN